MKRPSWRLPFQIRVCHTHCSSEMWIVSFSPVSFSPREDTAPEKSLSWCGGCTCVKSLCSVLMSTALLGSSETMAPSCTFTGIFPHSCDLVLLGVSGRGYTSISLLLYLLGMLAGTACVSSSAVPAFHRCYAASHSSQKLKYSQHRVVQNCEWLIHAKGKLSL